ncbi:MAG: hypothetical protein JWO09_3538 [Bacteroidetes bacterium]|nr:hypothetical protein [Bacteroidota bacterium]
MNQLNKRLLKVLSRPGVTKFFLTSLTALLASACNESSMVGLDVQPAGDLLNVGWQDSTTLVTSTVKEDSLHTDGSIIIGADALLGTYLDPVFGKTSAAIYTQLRLPANNPNFGTSPVCDSVVLSLTYASDFYGKKERKVQRVNVYQLLGGLSLSNNYYSNNSLSYNSGNDLANGHLFTPRPIDKVVVMGDTLKPHLRIPLEQNFGQVILNSPSSGSLSSNTAFQNFIKGFYITSDVTSSASGDGNILHFKLADAQTKLTIYYHNSNATNNDSLKYDISLSSVPRFSAFEHYNYAGAYSYLSSQLTSAGTDTALFVQSLAGTKVKIEFPYLLHWNDSGKIAINKAELVIKVDTSNPLYQLDTFAAPTRLVLFGITSTNTNYAVPDAYEANETFDGSYNAANKEYRFNIDRYVQQVLNGTLPNVGLYLVASGGAVNANRVVLGSGSSQGSQKMKLNLTYTKLH